MIFKQPIGLALVRRVSPSLLANEIVKVEPMKGPSGLAHALKFIYQKNNAIPEFDMLAEREEEFWNNIGQGLNI
jgi:hypothetical protein